MTVPLAVSAHVCLGIFAQSVNVPLELSEVFFEDGGHVLDFAGRVVVEAFAGDELLEALYQAVCVCVCMYVCVCVSGGGLWFLECEIVGVGG